MDFSNSHISGKFASLLSSLVIIFAVLFGTSVHAADVLHVDTGDDLTHQAKGIPAVLSGDGHVVTSITDQAAAFAALNGTLIGVYDLVVWDNYSDEDSSELSNLSSFVSAGGAVMAIGYDSIYQTGMPAFLGGSSALDTTSAGDELDPVVSVANSLTTGVVDIRGLTPDTTASGSVDLDSLEGLGGSTVAVVTSIYGNHWTLLPQGAGEIAFVSTSWDFDFDGDDAVYTGALRNFAASSGGVGPAPAANAIPTMSAYGLILTSLGLLLVATRRLRVSAKKD